MWYLLAKTVSAEGKLGCIMYGTKFKGNISGKGDIQVCCVYFPDAQEP